MDRLRGLNRFSFFAGIIVLAIVALALIAFSAWFWIPFAVLIALAALGVTELDERTVAATLGTVLKYREDQERTHQHGIAELVKQAFERGFQER